MQAPRSKMISYSRATHTGKRLAGQVGLHLWVICIFPRGFTVFFSFRVLQHPNILQCLGQCVEAIPILLVFEYCEMVSVRPPLVSTDSNVWTESALRLSSSALVFPRSRSVIKRNEIGPSGCVNALVKCSFVEKCGETDR